MPHYQRSPNRAAPQSAVPNPFAFTHPPWRIPPIKISIAGLDRAAVLAALHNHTRAIGLGALHDLHRDMTVDEAKAIIERGHDSAAMFGKRPSEPQLYFDYVQGRPLKIDITGDEFDPWLYDRDAGEGRAAKAIATIRAADGTDTLPAQKPPNAIPFLRRFLESQLARLLAKSEENHP